MKISAEGLQLLKRAEGYRGRVYLDAAGLPTIGYGHRLVHPESFAAGLTEEQAAELLAADVEEAERAVTRLVRVPLQQGQFDALVDFVYNLGSGRLAKSTLLAMLNCGRYDDALEQLLHWDHVNGQENGGLKARRTAESALWRGASTTDSSEVIPGSGGAQQAA